MEGATKTDNSWCALLPPSFLWPPQQYRLFIKGRNACDAFLLWLVIRGAHTGGCPRCARARCWCACPVQAIPCSLCSPMAISPHSSVAHSLTPHQKCITTVARAGQCAHRVPVSCQGWLLHLLRHPLDALVTRTCLPPNLFSFPFLHFSVLTKQSPQFGLYLRVLFYGIIFHLLGRLSFHHHWICTLISTFSLSLSLLFSFHHQCHFLITFFAFHSILPASCFFIYILPTLNF